MQVFSPESSQVKSSQVPGMRAQTFRASYGTEMVPERLVVFKDVTWPTNQPTKRLTKGGVLRKTSSIARLNHSCVRNNGWNLKKNLKYSNWGYACADGFIVLAEGLDMFRLGATATGGKGIRRAICPSRKGPRRLYYCSLRESITLYKLRKVRQLEL
jgi:hypothetical protein